MKKGIVVLFLSSFLIVIDQLSKYLIRQFGGFYICNKHLAFGLNVKHGFYLILLVLAVIIFLTISKFKIQNSKFQFKMQNYYFLVLILSGGLSNIIDRVYNGCVIDFVDLRFWPVFNLADVFIVLGVIMLILKFYQQPTTNN